MGKWHLWRGWPWQWHCGIVALWHCGIVAWPHLAWNLAHCSNLNSRLILSVLFSQTNIIVPSILYSNVSVNIQAFSFWVGHGFIYIHFIDHSLFIPSLPYLFIPSYSVILHWQTMCLPAHLLPCKHYIGMWTEPVFPMLCSILPFLPLPLLPPWTTCLIVIYPIPSPTIPHCSPIYLQFSSCSWLDGWRSPTLPSFWAHLHRPLGVVLTTYPFYLLIPTVVPSLLLPTHSSQQTYYTPHCVSSRLPRPHSARLPTQLWTFYHHNHASPCPLQFPVCPHRRTHLALCYICPTPHTFYTHITHSYLLPTRQDQEKTDRNQGRGPILARWLDILQDRPGSGSFPFPHACALPACPVMPCAPFYHHHHHPCFPTVTCIVFGEPCNLFPRHCQFPTLTIPFAFPHTPLLLITHSPPLACSYLLLPAHPTPPGPVRTVHSPDFTLLLVVACYCRPSPTPSLPLPAILL